MATKKQTKATAAQSLDTVHEKWAPAVAHLRSVDPRWHPILDRVGPCLLRPRRDHFGTLVRAIVGQQISAKAATSIDRRLRAVAGDRHTPEGLLAAGVDRIRTAGLSGVKASYVINLATAVEAGEVVLTHMNRFDDESVIEMLTRVKGIGRWTAEMFLIFALGRPDVLPLGDLGIRVGLSRFHGLDSPPPPSRLTELAEPWRPYRSIAMWYLWREGDAGTAKAAKPPAITPAAKPTRKTRP
jgi:DNA-3-methyladenine glycosylase II